MLAPREGFRGPVTDPIDLQQLAGALAAGTGPVALDTERASGYRYSQGAQLVQLRRPDVGTVLLDPVALGDLEVLAGPLSAPEWVLHAATQDLPCLAEAGLRPQRLFDTELAGRLLGLPRVGLGPMVEQLLGLSLQKGHGSDDWSVRPLPDTWLVYAALDVEVLIELRDLLASMLAERGRLVWAQQEFAALVAAPSAPPRVDPWRRTSGIHKVRNRRVLAVVRELWDIRDGIGRRRDIAVHRILPDSAIVDAAVTPPTSADALAQRPVFRGRAQRKLAGTWMGAVDRAMALPENALPPVHLPVDGPPPPSRWASKDPAAHARLIAGRAGLTALAQELTMPVENLVTPSLVRAVLWDPPDADLDAVAERLHEGGARPWQIELTAGILTDALGAAVAVPDRVPPAVPDTAAHAAPGSAPADD